jgi:hypothetical protein
MIQQIGETAVILIIGVVATGLFAVVAYSAEIFGGRKAKRQATVMDAVRSHFETTYPDERNLSLKVVSVEPFRMIVGVSYGLSHPKKLKYFAVHTDYEEISELQELEGVKGEW